MKIERKAIYQDIPNQSIHFTTQRQSFFDESASLNKIGYIDKKCASHRLKIASYYFWASPIIFME